MKGTTSKKIKIKILERDSPAFIIILDEIINRIIVRDDIAEISVVRIKNWFDHKWLNYSGKGVIHYKMTTHPDEVALTDFWKEKITVPPFNPNRVLSELSFHKHATGNKAFDKALHRWQRSSENQNNRIKTKSANGLFIWYSSNTEENQQGSIMAYRVVGDNVDTWYASFENKDGWKVIKTKGINIDELKDLGV